MSSTTIVVLTPANTTPEPHTVLKVGGRRKQLSTTQTHDLLVDGLMDGEDNLELKGDIDKDDPQFGHVRLPLDHDGGLDIGNLLLFPAPVETNKVETEHVNPHPQCNGCTSLTSSKLHCSGRALKP